MDETWPGSQENAVACGRLELMVPLIRSFGRVVYQHSIDTRLEGFFIVVEPLPGICTFVFLGRDEKEARARIEDLLARGEAAKVKELKA